MRLKSIFIVFFFSSLAFAQTKGTVTGTLTDREVNNAPLPFANAVIKGTTTGAVTDENGKYSFKVDPGNYTIVFSFLGYENTEVVFSVAAGETVTINKVLGSGNYKVEDVIVKGTVGREKETALLLEQKKAVEIKQSIGAQEMSRKGVSDVEEGLTKITGITKVGSRGLFVRGLEDRYNNLLINDLAAPTNNPFKKIIPLDLFPTDIVSVIEVYKTFNPNIYGDFAGGTFNILTSKGSKSITKLTIGAGYTTQNSLHDFLISDDADNTKGFFGFNGKDRELPSLLGKYPKSHKFTTAEAQQSLDGYNVNKTKSPLNSSIGILHSERFDLKGNNVFSYLLSLNFDNAYTFHHGVDRTVDNASTGFKYTTDFLTSEYRYKNASTGLLALNFNNDRVKLTANFLYIKTSENTIQDQFGSPAQGQYNRLIRTNQLDQSDYINMQLLGEYALTKSKNHSIKAGISFANTKYEQPDRKSIEGDLASEYDTDFTVLYGGSSFLRQYLKINGDRFVSGMAEYAVKFGKGDEKQNKFTIGYNGNSNEMATSYRFISAKSTSDNPYTSGYTTDINNIDAHVDADLANNYFYFEENSSSNFRVRLSELTNAGYGNLLLKFGGKWEINGGIRFENSDRETKYRRLKDLATDRFQSKKYVKSYFLPSLNVKYSASEKTNFRFAASKTYTRPVIMEAFPLTYLNADGTSIQGNPILKNSDNYNADIKFEIFPTSKEMMAVGIFTKYLKNPIERDFISNATTSTITSYLNSDDAALYGLEAEFIVGLERINKSLSDFSLGFNASLLKSRVNVKLDSESQDENNHITKITDGSIETFKYQSRELQGASKLMINSDLKYQFNLSKTWSNTASLVYAVFSKRIYAVGTNGQDHTYELPFSQLDFVWGSKLSEHLDLKFSADNLLNPTRRLILGNNGEHPIAEYSDIVNSYKKGIGFSLSLSYTF